MQRAVVIDAVRTPTGKWNGKLEGYHPVDLAAVTLRALVERNDLDPALVDDVIMGCVMQTGEQGVNVGRNAALAAGFPEDVVGTTIDRQCGSSQQSSHFAAQGVIAGAYDVAIAAGVESMTRVPMGITARGPGKPFGPLMVERYARSLVPQGISAEIVADKWGLSRRYLDRIAYDSHMRAARATREGRFEREIVPVEVTVNGSTELMVSDEGIRPGTSLEVLAGLPPVFKPDGLITAGNSSQISDGAAAVVVSSPERAAELGLEPIAMIDDYVFVADDPARLFETPAMAVDRLLKKGGLTLADIDILEVNEAFAAQVLANGRALDWDPDKINVNGGGVALGHPIGASGARILVTLIHAMKQRGLGTGVAALCHGGGGGVAMRVSLV
jgi:acetyl-CoA acyltransferase